MRAAVIINDLSAHSSRSLKARLLLVLVNVLSIGALVWTLRGAKLGELKEDLATMDWKWVAFAIVAGLVVYLWQAMRWSLVLRPVVRVEYWETVRAIFVGLFANEVLPLRAGEVLRCFLLSRWTEDLPFSVALSSFLIERILDGIWLCVCLLLTLHYLYLPHHLRYLTDGAYVLAGSVIGGAVVLGIAMARRERQPPSQWPSKGWRRHLAILMHDLNLIGHSRYLYFALLQSLPYLLLQVIPVYAAFKGYGFDFSLSVAFSLTMILRLGSAIPQAPGNLGVITLLTKEILQWLFRVPADEAARFSLVLWGIMTLPLLGGGYIALSIEEADLIDLKRDAQNEAAGLRKRV